MDADLSPQHMVQDLGELPASKAAGPEDDEPGSGLVHQVSAFPSNISPWPHMLSRRAMLSRASCIIPAEIAGDSPSEAGESHQQAIDSHPLDWGSGIPATSGRGSSVWP